MVGLPGGSEGKEFAYNAGDAGSVPGSGRSLRKELEKEMATCSSILAWRIPWTEEPGEGYSPWDCKESDTTEQLTHFEDFGQWKRLGSRAGQTWFKSLLTL